MSKHVYFFGEGRAEGDPMRRDLLGGKGAGLAEMTSLGLPVPPGFTISTEACNAFSKTHEHAKGLEKEVASARERDSMGQDRVPIDGLVEHLRERLS